MVVLMAVVATSCSSDSTYLPALLNDPMAGYSHPGLTVVSKSEIPKGEDFTGGPRKPRVLTLFKVDGDSEAIVVDALAAAEANGWVFREEAPVETADGGFTWSASKEMAVGLAGLDITLQGPDEEVDLSIQLIFREEY